MCDETRSFSIPMGDKFKTLGDIYDNTPSDLITKVMLEEKVFETWYSGRTVLMGDCKFGYFERRRRRGAFESMSQLITAFVISFCPCLIACHKVNPSGAQGKAHQKTLFLPSKRSNVTPAGKNLLTPSYPSIHLFGPKGAMIAMHDAAALANVLYTLPSSPSISDLETAFSEYRSERYPPAKESFDNSLMLSKSIERGFVGALTRFFMKYRPGWLWRLALQGMVQHRTTVGFLPKVPEKGAAAPKVSPSEVKARAVFEKRVAAAVPL